MKTIDIDQIDQLPGIKLEVEGIKGAVKYVLAGEKEGAPNFIMRYIQLAPGGHSKLERHPWEHEVIIKSRHTDADLNNHIFSVLFILFIEIRTFPF